MEWKKDFFEKTVENGELILLTFNRRFHITLRYGRWRRNAQRRCKRRFIAS